MEAIKPEDLHTMIGKEKCTSWFVVDQERINIFADVSEDPQFIHVDPEKASYYANSFMEEIRKVI